jgi:excisionase family DNA binding protein
MGARKPRREESVTSSDRDPPTAMVSVKELSRYLNVARGTILRLVENGQIPYTRVGRSLRFDVVAVRGALDRNT